jgi:hypothetical protein
MNYDINKIKKFEISPASKSSGKLVNIKFPEDFFILASTLSIYTWNSVEKIYKAISEKYGYSYNDIGFTFPSEAMEWGEIIEGVKVYNPMGELILTEEIFEILISKYFRALISYADINKDPVKRSSWWLDFIRTAEFLENKLKLKQNT